MSFWWVHLSRPSSRFSLQLSKVVHWPGFGVARRVAVDRKLLMPNVDRARTVSSLRELGWRYAIITCGPLLPCT